MAVLGLQGGEANNGYKTPAILGSLKLGGSKMAISPAVLSTLKQGGNPCLQ